MKAEYDKETDTLTITLRDARVKESDEIRPGVIADFGYDGGVVGFEIRVWIWSISIRRLIRTPITTCAFASHSANAISARIGSVHTQGVENVSKILKRRFLVQGLPRGTDDAANDGPCPAAGDRNLCGLHARIHRPCYAPQADKKST